MDRTIDAFSVANAYFIYKLNKIGNLELSFRVNNIFNKKYETAGYYDNWCSVYGTPGNYYFPAAGRNLMVGIRVGF
ncbi:MAG: TonB-dependent receptor [Candidatus Cloacimonetes bacterium]|nr:TonB-dependent receptor [Candidatus Cloacimonadota bacterium]